MKALKFVENLEFNLNLEIKEAWEYWMTKKENELKETGKSFNGTGCYVPNAYESAIESVSQIKEELMELCAREFKISKILISKIEDIEDIENDY